MSRTIAVVAVAFFLGSACSKSDATTPSTTPSTTEDTQPPAPADDAAGDMPAGDTAAAPQADPKAEATAIFAQRCAMCHGASGKGDGAAAANLNPAPRDYTDKAWQASVTDDALHKIIVEGGTAVGKSMLMPGNPDLKSKPEVVAQLVAIIRGFAQ